jgi:hypothetical protein
MLRKTDAPSHIPNGRAEFETVFIAAGADAYPSKKFEKMRSLIEASGIKVVVVN